MAGYPVTPQAARIGVEEASERPYEQAVRHLADRHEIAMGKELLENLTKTVGEYWLSQDEQRIKLARAHHTAPPERSEASECLIFADGVKVHTDGSWHEARVGTVRSRTADGASHKSSIVRLGALQAFGEDLWRHACEMGYRSASQVAFIADGSHWLWSIAEQYFQRAIKIADFWHVCENVCACAKVFFGEGTEPSRQWSVQVCEQLRAGQVQAALQQVEVLNPRSNSSRREAKHTLVTYLTNNRGRMDYPGYEALGLPIGSGEVEAQCKSLVQARCKQAGMRWHTRGIEPLLRVRCAVKDGRYERDFGLWPSDLSAWQAQRKRLLRKSA
ncbi:MAG: hypothetical protein EHM35_06525 [Planctomycetaceae bacterium]|nr:MAG: hypothetical protein EHM35_06525 [Planctomycetaceae bacterium]